LFIASNFNKNRVIRMEELTGEIDPFEEYLRGGKQLDLWQPEKT